MQAQLKIGDKVLIYGFGTVSENEDAFGLFEGEPGVIKGFSGTLVTVTLDAPSAEAQVHYFQVVPMERSRLC